MTEQETKALKKFLEEYYEMTLDKYNSLNKQTKNMIYNSFRALVMK